MRSLALALAALCLPGVAGAATLDLTASLLGIQVAELPALSVHQDPDPVPIAVSSGGGSFVLPPGLFASSQVFPTALNTGVSLIETLSLVVDNQAMSFSAAGGQAGGFGGVGPLTGVFRIGVLAGLVNLSIPLSVAGGGGFVRTGAAALVISVTGHLWTTGRIVIRDPSGIPAAAVTTTTMTGYRELSGYDNRTAGHAGALQLVTPVRVISNAVGGPLHAFGTMTLQFVPQPGALLLLLSSAAGLIAVGRLRRRR